MKKILILLLIANVLSISLLAQDNRTRGKKGKQYGKQYGQISGGWNHSIMDLSGFNNVLAFYNESLSDGSEKFASLDFLQGPSAALSFYGAADNKKFTRTMFEIGFSGRWKKLNAFNAALEEKQSVKLNASSAHIRFGTLPVLTTNFDIGLGIGVDGSMVEARASRGESILENVQTDFLVAASVFMPIYIGFGKKSPLSLGIRPYYQYQFKSVDFQKLNQYLSPDTYQNLAPEKQKSRFNNYGIEAHLVIVFSKRFLEG